MTITLPPEVEDRVRREAARRGGDVDGWFRSLIDRELPPPSGPVVDDPTVALFERVRHEDQTDDPIELARRQRETDELLDALERDRRATD